jgi:hypothetical protein
MRLRKVELVTAVVLTSLILSFHIIRLLKAGGLWRDEAAAVQLATMPSLKDVLHYFPHEAFPLLFPATVRSWSLVAGNSDLSWRIFGFFVGVGIVAALWWNLWKTRRSVPLLSLALLGFNAAFIQWGNSMRGYGLGILLLLITAGLVWRLVELPADTRWAGPPAKGSTRRGRTGKDAGSTQGKRTGMSALLAPFASIPNFRARLLLAVFFAVASVQCLLHNTILLFAICVGAMTLTIVRKRVARGPSTGPIRPLDFSYLLTYTVQDPAFMAVFVVGFVALLSLLPCWIPLSEARSWDIVVRLPVTLDGLCTKINLALSSSFPWNAWVWGVLLLGGFGFCMASQSWPDCSSFGREQRSILLVSGATLFVAVIGYFAFLLFLSYPTEPWYYLALMAVVALFLDIAFDALSPSLTPALPMNLEPHSLALASRGGEGVIGGRLREFSGATSEAPTRGNLSLIEGEEHSNAGGTKNPASSSWLRYLRLLLALLVAALSFFPTWRQAHLRLTNIDLIANVLNLRADKQDYIVVAPWNNGISFSRYYHGAAPWATVPPLEFHQFHRYDMVKNFMVMSDQNEPIRGVEEKIANTLKAGHRVWVVGVKFLPMNGEQVPDLPPAPDPKYGWLNEVYSGSWAVKIVRYVQATALHTDEVSIDARGRVNSFEDLPLRKGEGWGGL